MGTKMRPYPLTPQNEVSRRPEFWLTMATRSPGAMPSWSSRAAWARDRSAISLQVFVPSPPPGGSGSSTSATRWP